MYRPAAGFDTLLRIYQVGRRKNDHIIKYETLSRERVMDLVLT